MTNREKPRSRILSIKINDMIFSLIVCFYVLFDSINGFFIGTLGIHLPISLSIKSLILLMSLVVIFKCKNKILSLFSLVIVFVFPIFFRALFLSQEFFFIELNYLLKYISFLIFIYYFYNYYSNVIDSYKPFYRLVYISYWIIVLNVSLGFFGIGGYTYPNTSTGFKGFFVAGNELSALFILFTILIYGRLIGEDRGFISSIFILFSIFISILIGTKSSVLLLTLTMFIYPLYAKLINREYFSTLKVSLILFVPISAFALFFYHFGENVQSISTIERIIYKLDSHHIINAIFSGREIWFEMYMNYLYEHGLVSSVYFSVIFGSGFYYSTKATLGKHLIESDLLDLYTLSGVIGVFIVVSISIYFAYIILSSKKNGKIWKEALYVHLALTLIAIFFGHVWTSGMLSVAYASMIGFTFSQRVVKC